eukprot:7661763-Pyramimonas_sp.AAC.1
MRRDPATPSTRTRCGRRFGHDRAVNRPDLAPPRQIRGSPGLRPWSRQEEPQRPARQCPSAGYGGGGSRAPAADVTAAHCPPVEARRGGN